MTQETEKRPAGSEKVVHVRSDLAEPSRPEGHFGVHQPIPAQTPTYRPPEPPASDAELAERVRAALDDDGRAGAGDVTVSVNGAVVDLHGEVEREFHRTLVAALAQSVPGVLSVNNHLAIRVL
ncbi:BON domain-containing protein [Celeribacter indicus]|uniref:BON domain-containing protein n=1 Tax=Celeribacter indicus TaxID=1208324 RepID=A0A0B5E7N4_9RHOB|nr:BON domain-containing protein [Celeribacter indicus]AJE49071.1 hypothetical protein P73_4356 [Celeribacter indicus]SDW45176.1 BON domain-containing protein [Celeribacter indicus]